MLAAALIWYRRDLRTADHEPLQTASRNCQIVIPFTTVDPAHFKSQHCDTMPMSLPLIGPFRAELVPEVVDLLVFNSFAWLIYTDMAFLCTSLSQFASILW